MLRLCAAVLVLLLGAGCGYREAPKSLTFQGKTYKLGGAGRYVFLDRNLYFLPGENKDNRTFSVDLSRAFDKKRTEAEVHSILRTGLMREVKKVLYEREDGTSWCAVYEETPGRFYVSYHVTGAYKHGFWATDYSHALENVARNDAACDDAVMIWRDLKELGEQTK